MSRTDVSLCLQPTVRRRERRNSRRRGRSFSASDMIGEGMETFAPAGRGMKRKTPMVMVKRSIVFAIPVVLAAGLFGASCGDKGENHSPLGHSPPGREQGHSLPVSRTGAGSTVAEGLRLR